MFSHGRDPRLENPCSKALLTTIPAAYGHPMCLSNQTALHEFGFSQLPLARGPTVFTFIFFNTFIPKGPPSSRENEKLLPHPSLSLFLQTIDPSSFILCSSGHLARPCVQPFQGTPSGALASRAWEGEPMGITQGPQNQVLWSRACSISRFSRWLYMPSVTAVTAHLPSKGSRGSPWLRTLNMVRKRSELHSSVL